MEDATIPLFLKKIEGLLECSQPAALEKRVRTAWPMQISQELTPDALDALHIFASKVDSPDLRDRRLPLRLEAYLDKGRQIGGDPGVQLVIVKAFLHLLFPSAHSMFASLCHCLADKQAGYFFSLLQASLALDLDAYEDCEKYLLAVVKQQTDCVFASRINTLLVAGSSGRHGIAAAGQDLSDRICLHPFNTVMSFSSGTSPSYSLRMCDCPGLLPYDLDDPSSWNGPVAQEIRRSMFDGDFSYCTRISCFHILQKTLPRKAEITDPYIRQIIDNRLTCLPRGPYSIILAHDKTCNLVCPSCRRTPFHANAEQQAMHDAFAASRILPLMGDNLHWLRLGFTGEGFASPHIMSFITSLDNERFKNLKYFAITNGSLLNQKTWAKLGSAANRMTHLRISIDGASKDIYESLRPPARWETLLENMKFVRALRKQGEVKYLCVICIVQKTNVPDLEKLYQYCLDWEVDEMVFAPLRNWGAFDGAFYQEHNVALPDNPLYETTRTILNDITTDAASKPITVHTGLY